MFIAITENRSGEIQLLRRLAPNESIDAEFHARKWAQQMGVDIAKSSGYIPHGCGDYTAETRRTKIETGSCWNAFEFYLEWEE